MRMLTPDTGRRGIGLCCTDSTGRIVWANDPVAEQLNKELRALIGQRLEAAATAARVALYGLGLPGRTQIAAGVREHDHLLHAIPLASDTDQTLWLLWGMEGVSHLVRELLEVFDYVRDGVVVADARGVILDMNRAAEDFGLQRWEVGKSVDELMGGGTFTGSAIQKVVESGQPATTMVQRSHRTGVSSAYPVFDSSGRLWRIIACMRDITEIQTLRQQLEIAKGMSQSFEQELRKKQSMADVVAVSKNIKDVFDLAARLAEVDVPVFVEGESGVGKEVVAKFMHRHSNRQDGPFVRINCGAIPGQLLESELFGYEAGAFTGANQKGKPGLLELADRGTLFLDEVAELPLELQVKLLHALQDQELTRVGGLKARRFNARIVAATNRNISEMVRQGTFREDLFYRLYVIPVRVPPLRERRADIPILLAHFTKHYGTRFGITRYLDPQVIHLLTEYDWPGNVRELINLVERLLVTTPGELVTEADLPPRYREGGSAAAGNIEAPGPAAAALPAAAVAVAAAGKAAGAPVLAAGTAANAPIAPLADVLAECEQQHLQRALSQYRTQDEAARALGISLASLTRRIRAYGLRPGRRGGS